jgi:hypothetical protein
MNFLSGCKEFTRRSVPHELSFANRAKQVADARTLFPSPENGQSQNFSHIVTEEESWFNNNYGLPITFGRAPDQVVARVSPTIGSKKTGIRLFFTKPTAEACSPPISRKSPLEVSENPSVTRQID